MRSEPDHGKTSPGASQRRQIDQIRDRFEAAWKVNQRPTIEDYLGSENESDQEALFRELLLLELYYRRHRDETPTAQEYEARFSEYSSVLADVFRATVVSSRHAQTLEYRNLDAASRGLQVRCPHCHDPTKIDTDTPLVDLVCSSCGSHFSLAGEEVGTRAAATVTTIGHFELIERLGVGGFGTVWKARDTNLDRAVAVKIPRKGQLETAELEQFFREARMAAQLVHPNIVSVHEVGRDGDTVYIVSDIVRGIPLSDWLTGQQLTIREAAELCVKIADALDHAHEKGVIHRDLKPQNIMIDADMEPHLMDFGLARREVGEITMTIDGQVLGTPAYMSPEQAQGMAHRADRRSDIYSFGILLFELLTGELPFRGNARMLIHQVINEEAPTPRKLNSNIPRDIETICLKCIEKAPGRRYQTARELSAELGRWLDGKPIRARPIGRLERAWRWCNHNRLVAALAAAVISSLVTIAIVATFGYIYTSRALLERNEAATTAEQVAEFLTTLFRASDPIGWASGDNFEFSRRDDNASLVTTRELLARGADRIESELNDQPGIQTTLMDTIGGVYRAIGLYEDAIYILRRSLNLRQNVLERNGQKIAATMQNLGMSLFFGGQIDEAEQYYREALRLRLQHLGEEHLEVTSTMYSLALLLTTTDRQDEATNLMQKVIAIRRKFLGDNSQGVAIGLAGLAAIYLNDDKAEEAQSAIVEAYLIFRESGGHTVSSQLLMDFLQGVQAAHEEKYFEAVPLLASSVKMTAELLGEAHPFVAYAKTEYGKALEGLGRYAEAEFNYRDAIDIVENSVGIQHISIIPVRYDLAQILQQTNRRGAAEDILQKLIEDVRQVHGSGSPELAICNDSLADLQRSDGRYEQAERSSREALRIARIAFDDDVAKIPSFLRQSARCLIAQDKTDEAIALLREALALEAEYGTNGKYHIGQSLQLLAEALTQSGQAQEAEGQLRSAWRAAQDDLEQTDEYRARYECLLGAWLVAQLRYDEAEKHLLSSYSVFTGNLDEDHNWTKETRGELRSLYQQWNKPDKLAQYTDDDQSTSPTTSPPSTVDTAR